MGLVLSRRVGERIYIGDGIVLTLTDVRHGRARIDIECDRGVKIYREELAPPGVKSAIWKRCATMPETMESIVTCRSDPSDTKKWIGNLSCGCGFRVLKRKYKAGAPVRMICRSTDCPRRRQFQRGGGR